MCQLMENKKIIKLAFTGDILSYECQNKAIKKKYGEFDYTSIYEGVTTLLSQADYVIGSLETPIAGLKAGYTRNPIVFNTPETILKSLKLCGFDMLTTANNHCLDRGIEGLKNTLYALDNCGIEHTGTQLNVTEPNYLVKDLDGLKIGFVSFTYGTNAGANKCYLTDETRHMVNLFKKQPSPAKKSRFKEMLVKCFLGLAPKKVRSRIRPLYPTRKIADCGTLSDLVSPEMKRFSETIVRAKRESDFVIALPHLGGQFNDIPGEFSRSVMEMCVDSGADMVIGNHSHVVLPIEQYHGKWIAHCLGNFSFTPGDGYYFADVLADYSILLFMEIDKQTHVITPSFSILKNVIGEDGISRVVDTSELCGDTSVETDVRGVFARFTKGTFSSSPQRIYTLDSIIKFKSELSSS